MMLEIIPIPAFKDNYIWLLFSKNNKRCIIVDPGDAEPVLRMIANLNLTPTAIFVTHHHYDHCAGVEEIIQRYPVPVYGSAKENSTAISSPVNGGQKIPFPDWQCTFEVIEIPGHTLDHIAFYSNGILFCGDTLFTGGCGRLFEGTAKQLYESLNILAELPEETLIYCGHEYTLSNLEFANTVEPHNPIILQRLEETKSLVEQGWPTVPASLKIEKQTNPFLRIDKEAIIHSIDGKAGQRIPDPVERFAYLREWKNYYK